MITLRLIRGPASPGKTFTRQSLRVAEEARANEAKAGGRK